MKGAMRAMAVILGFSAQIFPGSAASEDLTSGNYWVKLCRQADRRECSAFLLGLREANSYDQYVRKIPQYCLPVGVTIDQLRQVILRQYDEKPDLLHMPFALASIAFLQKTFPCP